MVTNENNSYINSFTKGMNSDTAFDQIDNAQYIYGQNIRITKNQLLSSSGDYSSVHEGIVTPVPSGVDLSSLSLNVPNQRIIAVCSVDQIAIVVTTNGIDLYVWKFTVDEVANRATSIKKVWFATGVWSNDAPNKISAVLYKELENVIKLYIATGKHPIISLRVDDESDGNYIKNGTPVPIDSLINNREIPDKRVVITDIISGRLTTQQVQYTYRYYNKYGNTTQLAPLTNKIQVIDSSRSKETGNAENTETSVGLSLSIDMTGYSGRYKKIQVYRLSYITPGHDAEVSLIYDGDIKDQNNSFVLNDIGIDPLQKLSMEEFAAMSGLILIPQAIEQNQEYMFCGNITDDTILKNVRLGTAGSIREVTATVVLSDKIDGDIPDPGKHYYKDEYSTFSDGSSVLSYLTERGVNPQIVKASYNDMITSSLLRSLRRGEKYKYALVFYDSKGRRTDVISLDEKTISDYNTSRPFECVNGKLLAHPIGVKIQLPTLTGDRDAISSIVGCQVIRRSSSEVYQKTLLQVALARPISQAVLDTNIQEISDADDSVTKKSPFYPSGFMSVNGLYIFPSYYYKLGIRTPSGEELGYYADLRARTRNHKLYQIFSSEIDFRRNDVLSKVNTSDTSIEEMLYVSSVFAKYTNSTKDDTYDGTLPGSMTANPNSSYYTPEETVRTYNVGVVHGEGNMFAVGSLSTSAQSVLLSVDDPNVTDVQFMRLEPDSLVAGPVMSISDNVMSHSSVTDFINEAAILNRSIVIKVDLQYQPTTLTVTTRIPPVDYDSQEGTIGINRLYVEKLSSDKKQARHWIFNFYKTNGGSFSGFGTQNVNQIKDVKIPEWSSAFSEIQRNEDQDIYTAIKKYKSFTTNIDSYVYNNWVSFAKYDLRPGEEDQANMDYTTEGGNGPNSAEMHGTTRRYRNWLQAAVYPMTQDNQAVKIGYIGAGPSCFLLTTENETGLFPLNSNAFYTSICNITHEAKTSDVQSDEFTQYYGFGNYFNVSYNANGTPKDNTTLTVFDGDVYITPHELGTMYKAYDFNSMDTLQSTQVVNYIPLESKVNTYFDYGMNLMNTQSENLLYEPGYIDGVTTQDRPVHQYNMIYSDNDASNDVFTLISTDKNETNSFKQRTYYSDLKTNGEFIDNFLIFKAASFIDVDSKYGQITNLLTDKNMLYYWQDHACGRFSVNERSLVNDQNSNTIMLGQAGILSRYDYISTRYGMRLYDFCARSTEGGVFWIDINNKAIAALAESRAINVGEQLNIQNLVNRYITADVPHVDYDLQNDEVLCKCLGQDQMVLNIKYNIGTSIYTRRYDFMLYIKNHLYGLTVDNEHQKLDIKKHNYLEQATSYLYPLAVSFIVNPMASVTKVFDSQQFVPIKRDAFTQVDHSAFLEGAVMSFESDIINKEFSGNMEPYTDREGNVIYNIPRYITGDGYGNRIRGKWLRVNIKSTNPTEFLTISHIITKFRQSYS